MNNPTDIGTIGIIGGGKMGQSLFQFFQSGGHSLIWYVRDTQKPEILRWQKRLHRLLVPGQCLTISDKPEALTGCRYIIECVTEDIKIKQDTFALIMPYIDETCIVLTNSSSILPMQIAVDDVLKNRLAGLHFFYPVVFKPFVELIQHENLSPQLLTQIIGFCHQTGLSVISENTNQSYFGVNRLLLAFQELCFELCVNDKVSALELETWIKTEIHPEGVFGVCEQIGVGTLITSIKNYYRLNANPSGSCMLQALEAFQTELSLRDGSSLVEFMEEYKGKKMKELHHNKILHEITGTMQNVVVRLKDTLGLDNAQMEHVLDDVLGFNTNVIAG